MSKLYYGIGDVPNNKKRANMKEAFEKRQVRYYGTHKVDPRIIQLAQNIQEKKLYKQRLISKLISLRGRKKRMINLLKIEKNEERKEELKKDGRLLLEDLKETGQDLKDFENTGIVKKEKVLRKVNFDKKNKITCECGSIVNKSYYSKHQKSNKHINFIKKNIN